MTAKLMFAAVKELLARDFIFLVDRIDADLLDGLALAGGFARDLEGGHGLDTHIDL
jgi:hypothetical protein